jgi:hypothetical protein
MLKLMFVTYVSIPIGETGQFAGGPVLANELVVQSSPGTRGVE